MYVTLTLSLRVYINYHEHTRLGAESAACALAIYPAATDRGMGLGEINHTIALFLRLADSNESQERARGAPRETVVAIAYLAARKKGRCRRTGGQPRLARHGGAAGTAASRACMRRGRGAVEEDDRRRRSPSMHACASGFAPRARHGRLVTRPHAAHTLRRGPTHRRGWTHGARPPADAGEASSCARAAAPVRRCAAALRSRLLQLALPAVAAADAAARHGVAACRGGGRFGEVYHVHRGSRRGGDHHAAAAVAREDVKGQR